MRGVGVVALLAVLLVGCGGPPPAPDSGDASPEPGDAAPGPRGTTPPPAPLPHEPAELAGVLTEQDDGARVTMRTGERFALRLDQAWVWDAPHADGDAVAVVPVSYESDPGFTEWQIDAVATGEATITVAGEPNCPEPDECPPRTVELQVAVDG